MAERASESEMQVLSALWDEAPQTAADLARRVGTVNGWTQATVKTLLNRLLKKGAVSAERDGRRYLYAPVLQRDAWLVERDRELAGYATFAATGGRLRADGYVHPRHRGRGVGTELLRLTEERAAAEAERVPAPERVYLQNATLLGDGDRCTPRLYERGGFSTMLQTFGALCLLVIVAAIILPQEIKAPAPSR